MLGAHIDLQIGYRGWLKLLFNSPLVANVYSYAVYEDYNGLKKSDSKKSGFVSQMI